MIEVFRTNIKTQKDALFIVECLKEAFPQCQANFDLEDCENILRMESKKPDLDTGAVISLVKSHGFRVEILPDVAPICGKDRPLRDTFDNKSI